jgi:histidine triad (HIT) family protein
MREVYKIGVVLFIMREDCIFCKIINGEVPSDKILESDKFIVIKDIEPETEGHSLIIPKKHFESLLDLDESFYSGLIETIKEVAKKNNKDFNLVVNNGKDAGQIVNNFYTLTLKPSP